MTNVTCGLTAKKLESAPCATLVIEYGNTLLTYYFTCIYLHFILYLHFLQSAYYRLKLYSKVYGHATKCSISMEKFLIFWGGAVSLPRPNPFDISVASSPEIKFWLCAFYEWWKKSNMTNWIRRNNKFLKCCKQQKCENKVVDCIIIISNIYHHNNIYCITVCYEHISDLAFLRVVNYCTRWEICRVTLYRWS